MKDKIDFSDLNAWLKIAYIASWTYVLAVIYLIFIPA